MPKAPTKTMPELELDKDKTKPSQYHARVVPPIGTTKCRGALYNRFPANAAKQMKVTHDQLPKEPK